MERLKPKKLEDNKIIFNQKSFLEFQLRQKFQLEATACVLQDCNRLLATAVA